MNQAGSCRKKEKTGNCLRLPLTDAHAHIGSMEEVEERIRRQIPTMVSAGNPQEAERLEAILASGKGTGLLIPTYGLHPWHADRGAWMQMQPFLERSAVIGEIGMDSIWCRTPLVLQQEIFELQLAFAREKHRPVILHTKGEEKTIADIIRQYPNTYLVHWYSLGSGLENYMEMDCYFSVGPDVWWNPAVRKLAGEIAADRLLIETDGMSAVRWAYEEAAAGGEAVCPLQIPSTLEEALGNTLGAVAEIRGTDCGLLAEQVRTNYLRFSMLPRQIRAEADRENKAFSR